VSASKRKHFAVWTIYAYYRFCFTNGDFIMAAPKGGGRARLLDVAEKIFAEKGYDAATTRDIAARAGDTLGTLSYHFKSKERLLAEVLRRRFDELTGHRRTMYREFVAARGGHAPSLEEAITAIIMPVMRLAMSDEPGWGSYLTIFGRQMYGTDDEHYALISDLIDPIGVEFSGWLSAAEPKASRVNIAHAYVFVIGCLFDYINQYKRDRLTRLTGGLATAFDFPGVSKRLLAFVIAGARAVLEYPLEADAVPSRVSKIAAKKKGQSVKKRRSVTSA
jgi:AcrR family transcriptional regulator